MRVMGILGAHKSASYGFLSDKGLLTCEFAASGVLNRANCFPKLSFGEKCIDSLEYVYYRCLFLILI